MSQGRAAGGGAGGYEWVVAVVGDRGLGYCFLDKVCHGLFNSFLIFFNRETPDLSRFFGIRAADPIMAGVIRSRGRVIVPFETRPWNALVHGLG